MLSEQTQSALHQAQLRYRAQLQERANDLEKLWQAAADGDEESYTELLRHLHRLGGSAGMYGLETLGQSAKAAYKGCQLLAPGQRQQSPSMQQLLKMMRDMAAH
ncbi:MAG: Hpt domain-containing protein [Xanthomonadales bacterium]|jgi:HPt (histidine-containing phosphotransfer) domain-containing protein|nr:Hpt domain-containing protein [Xanthomonadales bacterium]